MILAPEVQSTKAKKQLQGNRIKGTKQSKKPRSKSTTKQSKTSP
jgi:hypothetical protein